MQHQTWSFAYAALLLIGALIGFARGSPASLYAGGGAALTIFLLELAVVRAPAVAAFAQLAIAAILTYVMAQRFLRSGKFMPAGMVALLSLAMTGIYLNRALSVSKAHVA